jgi:pseudomonalisin
MEYFRDLVATPLPNPDPYHRASKQLNPGDILYSATRAFRLVFQTDGNLVLYAIDDSTLPVDITKGKYTKALWATGTNGMGVGKCAMQTDGNLVLYTGDIPAPASGLGSNSNYILYSNGKPLKGLSVTIDVTQDIVCQSVAAQPGTAVWASGTNGHPGAFLRCQDDGNVVIIGSNGVPISWANVYAG